MVYFLFCVLHLVVCALLIFFVLIQSNKGMGLSGAFGAVGAGENFMNTSNAFNLLVKITVGLSIFFACSSLGLSYFSPSGGTNAVSSVMEEFETAPQPMSERFQEMKTEQQAGTSGDEAAASGDTTAGDIPAGDTSAPQQ